MAHEAQPTTPYINAAGSVRAIHNDVFTLAQRLVDLTTAGVTDWGFSERELSTDDDTLTIQYSPIPVLGGVTSVEYDGVTLRADTPQDALCKGSLASAAEHFLGVDDAFLNMFTTHTEQTELPINPRDTVMTALHDISQSQDEASLSDIEYDVQQGWAREALSFYMNLEDDVETHSDTLAAAADMVSPDILHSSDRFLVVADSDEQNNVTDAVIFEDIKRGTALFGLHEVNQWDGKHVDDISLTTDDVADALGVDVFQYQVSSAGQDDMIGALNMEIEAQRFLDNGKDPSHQTAKTGTMRVNTGLAVTPIRSFTEHVERMIDEQQRERSKSFTRRVNEQAVAALGADDIITTTVTDYQTTYQRTERLNGFFIREAAAIADKDVEVDEGTDMSYLADRLKNALERKIRDERSSLVRPSDPPVIDNLHGEVREDIEAQADESSVSVGSYRVTAPSANVGADRLILPEGQVVRTTHPDYGRTRVYLHGGVYDIEVLSQTIDGARS